MKHIITGGAGFIGSHLVETLLKNKSNKIIIIDNFSTGNRDNLKNFNDKIHIIKKDISIKGKWMDVLKSADYVYHLAALADIVPSIENPKKYFQSNVTGTLNVILGCVGSKKLKKLIYTASSSCYGLPNSFPTDENSSIDNRYPYATTKYLGEKLIVDLCSIYNIPYFSLRLFNVYGTRSRTSGTYGAVFGVFLAQKLAGKPFTVVGNGKQTRDFTYVSDVVDAIILASFSKYKNLILNIASGKSVSVNKLVSLLGGPTINIPRRPGEPDCTWGNISLAKKKLRWKPKISIEKGVETILSNIDYWKKAPVWNPRSIKKATSLWFKYLR